MSPAEIIPYTSIFLLFIGLLLIAIVFKYPNERYFSKGSTMNFVVALIFLALISVTVFVFIFIMHYRVKALYSIDAGYDAADLTSSIIMAIVTVIYVIFTAFIFYTTNENTKQSIKNTEQTAKAQKVAYLERSLQLFYLPMQRALKTINMTELRTNLDTNPLMERKNDSDEENSRISGIFKQSLIDMFLKYDKEYLSIMIFSYFGTDKTNKYLTGFKDVYNDQIPHPDKLLDNFNEIKHWYFTERDDKEKYELAATDKKGFFNYYVLTKLQIKEDIQSIKTELARLMNL